MQGSNGILWLPSEFADHFIAQAEEEICHHADRLFSDNKKAGWDHPYSHPTKQAPDTVWKSGPLAWKQYGKGKKVRGKASQLFTETCQGPEFL